MAHAAHSSHPVEDNELLELYNQVLDGFANDPESPLGQPLTPGAPASLTNDRLLSIYSSYEDPKPSDPIQTPPAVSPTNPSSVAQLPRSPRPSDRPRPLPPIPPQQNVPTRPSMPEPKPFSHTESSASRTSAKSQHAVSEFGVPSYERPAPSRTTTGSSARIRKLPPEPNIANGSNAYDSFRPQGLNGLPKRPGTGGAEPRTFSSSENNRQSAPEKTFDMPIPYADGERIDVAASLDRTPSTSTMATWASDPSIGLNRQESLRPRGALAPVTPGMTRYGSLARSDTSSSFSPDYKGSPTTAYKKLPEAQTQYPPSDLRLGGYFPTMSPPTRSSSRSTEDPSDRSSVASGSGLQSSSSYSSSSTPASGKRLGRILPTSTEEEDQYSEATDSLGAMLMRSTSVASSVQTANDSRQSDTYGSSLSVDADPNLTRTPRAQPDRDVRPQPSFTILPESSSGLYSTPSIITTGAEPTSSNRVHDEYRRIASMKGPLELHEDDESDYDEDEDDLRFINLALLSHIAVRFRDKVPRGVHVKGSIPYPRAFTGKDIVSTIQSLIQRELLINLQISTSDRRPALQVARSLQSQLFFYEVEWGGRVLTDGVEDVYMFLDDAEGMSDGGPGLVQEELPTGVITMLTKCYSPSCVEDMPCYAYGCPRRTSGSSLMRNVSVGPVDQPLETKSDDWEATVDPAVLKSLPESEINRQTIIHQVIKKEEQYVQDLDIIESLYIKALRTANPPVIPLHELDDFIDTVFGNILDLRECNRRLLEVMFVRQREQAPIIQRIGDVFLTAAAEFRLAYPIYVGHLPVAEKRVKDEMETNAEFRRFLEVTSRLPESRRLDLKHFISRPSEHLQRYPDLLRAIFSETAEGNPDADFLLEAEQAIKNLSTVAQLRTFQNAMGRGPTGKYEWHDLIPKDAQNSVSKKEAKRQSIIFELIKGEMIYVKDLETIESLFIRPLRNANPSIIPRDRLSQFINDVFHNFAEIHRHHRRLLDRLHDIQREEHPVIRSITAPVFDAALNWRDAYMEYVPNYPIAAYRVDDEMANNLAFKTFVEQCIRNPEARKLDLKAFINRPIPRLLRYDLLLRGIEEASPEGHEDHDTIPQVLEVIKDLGKATEPGVVTAKQKVELWRYNSNLVFKPSDYVDMDLLAETRTLVHTGRLLRQPETGFEWSGFSELFVLLFDNYLVMTKPREKDGVTKYHVFRRPIPLELLSLANFTDPPQQRAAGLLRGLRGDKPADRDRHADPAAATGTNEATTDSRSVYPCTIHHNGRLGGLYTVYAESAAIRAEWKQKLEEAMGLRAVVQESNKVFEIETLSNDTFQVPSIYPSNASHWNEETTYTGKVTCSVPFTTSDGRGLIAIGCAEGVWIGLRHDSKSMRRVLHLKQVTQCAMLEDFGIFLVLADKSLFAYHIEALVPSNPPNANATRTPQKLNGNKDVQFFSVGTLGGRTLIIYMKKKNLDSVFRVLEPVIGKNAVEKTKNPGTFSRFAFGGTRSEWFRVYRDFFLPSEAYDLIFLKAKIAILCSKGFEIMDLIDFKSVTIPQREDPRLASLAKRCEACRPMGMFRASENEFLLCYDEFGIFVDRHGDPSRSSGTIEWEGTAERAACHPPYILLFDSRFIEIRRLDTGRLAQIIPGTEVRCLWDGRGGSVPPVATPGPDGWREEGTQQESRVHAVMKSTDPPGGRARAVTQHVFELVPTIALYLPPSLSSPTTSTYFPQSYSPPHSPQLGSWR